MQKIFTVHDSKAEAYLPPFYMKTTGEALRAFETTTKDSSSQFNKYPKDYTLVELGTYNEENAEIITHQKPLIIENASAYIQ